MKQYEKYKPSCIEYIGKMPEHWELERLKYSDEIIMGQSPKSDDYNDFQKGFPFLQGNADFGMLNPIPTTWCETANKVIDKGDILLSVRAPIGAVNIADQRYGIGRGLCAVRANKSNPKFLYFVLLSLNEELNSIGTGSTYTAISVEEVRNIYFVSPPHTEQTTIANFLDEKTTQIDKLISKKQKLIELLKEERTLVINEAVSGKGKNWESKKLKYVAKLQSGEGITADDIRPEGEFPVFGGNGLRGFTSTFTHEGDYILIGRQGALCGNINYASGKYFATEHAVVVTILDGSKFIWLGELLRSMNLNQYSQASAQPGLSVEKIQNLIIAVPSLKEQIIIVQYIQIETQRIDTTISKVEKEIELMQEYKTALISEAVTGKIKVI